MTFPIRNCLVSLLVIACLAATQTGAATDQTKNDPPLFEVLLYEISPTTTVPTPTRSSTGSIFSFRRGKQTFQP